LSGGLGRAQDAAEAVTILLEHRGEIMRDVVSELEARQLRLDAKVARLMDIHSSLTRAVDPARDEALLKRLYSSLGAAHDEYPGPQHESWKRLGCRTGNVCDELRGCGQASLILLVSFCERFTKLAKGLLVRHGDGTTAPDTFPFIMGLAQVSRMSLVALGFSNNEAKKMAELPSWVLLDEPLVEETVNALVVAKLDEQWDVQNARGIDFTRLSREVIFKLENALDDSQPETLADLMRALPGWSLPLEDEKAVDNNAPTHLTPPISSQKPAPPPPMPPLPATTSKASSEFLPQLLSASEIISPAEHILPLEASLPIEFQGYNWQICFSTTLHGYNLDSFYRQCKPHVATLLFIKDGRSVFGAFCTEAWERHFDAHFGNGQSFLFTFAHAGSGFRAHKWTQANNMIMLASDDSIAMGGGGNGFGLYVDGLDLGAGMSAACATFGNAEPLVPGPVNSEGAVDFSCQVIEVWYFVPKFAQDDGGGG
jgi:hypothetical protein